MGWILLKNSHNRHLIARLLGRDIGVLGVDTDSGLGNNVILMFCGIYYNGLCYNNTWLYMFVICELLTCWIVSKIMINVFTFWIVSRIRLDSNRWNWLWNNNTCCLSYTTNTVLADSLATLGASASAGIVLILKAEIFHSLHQKS